VTIQGRDTPNTGYTRLQSRLVSVVIALTIAASSTRNAIPADLDREDLRSVEKAFKQKDASLDRFNAREKKTLGSGRSILLVEADVRLRQNGPGQVGIFVVSGSTNEVQSVVDIFPESDSEGFPRLSVPTADSVILNFHDDYDIYHGSAKYFFDPSGGKPSFKYAYGRLELRSSSIRRGALVYDAVSHEKRSRVVIEPRAGDSTPAYSVIGLDSPPAEVTQAPRLIALPGGSSLLIAGTPPGREHQPSTIWIAAPSGQRRSYPVPVPTMESHRNLRSDEPAPNEIENDIGPYAFDGSTLWFANDFYDGEGTSGVGAIGSFDIRTRKFQMRYLPQISHWSGSALRIDGDDLWVGLMRQPEGAAYGGGLLRYARSTGAVRKYEIPDYIYTIDRIGDAIYCGANDGLYRIRGNEVTHFSFEPDRTGKIVMVSRR
jgi:hypothetical protein